MAFAGGVADVRGRRADPRSSGWAWAVLGLVLVTLWPASLCAQTAPLGDLTDWNLSHVTWEDRGGLPPAVEFTGQFTAHYNMGYGAVVLGLSVRSGTDYYAAVASYREGRLKALASFGPLSGPAIWDSGPHFVAASLPHDELMVWLTAPGEYPRPVSLRLPRSVFDCKVYPPPRFEPEGQHWDSWRITVAYEDDDYSARSWSEGTTLLVDIYDGRGRYLAGPAPLELRYSLKAVEYLDFPLEGGSIPYLLFAHEQALIAAYYDYSAERWLADYLAGEGLNDVALYLGESEAGALGLVLYRDETEAYSATVLHRLDLSAPRGEYVATRWGARGYLDAGFAPVHFAAAATTRSPYPLLIGTDDTSVHLAYYSPPRDAAPAELTYSSVRLHYGELAASGAAPRYPVMGVAAATHWQSGDPTVFWVQLGGPTAGGGQLYCLEYAPAR